MTGELQNRTAVILGGANGIGKACVQLFARSGARVVFGDIDEAGGERVAAGLRAEGCAAAFARCDVRSVSDIQAFVARARETFGVADIALYATGIIKPASFLDLTEESFDDVIEVNLRGAVFFFQSVAKALIEAGRPGSLVSISSIGGVLATDSTHSYGMSKAGLIHLAKSLAVSLSPYHIRANTVGPGGVNTPMQAKISVEDRRASLSRTPMLRLAEPEEIARVALFLASDAASYVTGQTIYADGGRLALHRTVKVPDEKR